MHHIVYLALLIYFFLSHSPIKVGFMAADPLFEEVSLRQHNPDGVKSTVLFRLRS